MDVTVQEERRIIVDLLPVVKDVAAPVAVVDSVPSDGLLRCHQPSLTTPPIPRSDGCWERPEADSGTSSCHLSRGQLSAPDELNCGPGTHVGTISASRKEKRRRCQTEKVSGAHDEHT
jgi:hypothetical protein